MSETLTVVLFNPVQAHGELMRTVWPWVKAMLIDGGRRLVITVAMMDKSREQEKKYHAQIGEIAKAAQHLGATWDVEDWKRLLIDKFARETGRRSGKVIPNLDRSGVVEVGILSRRFSVKDGSEFIEFLNAWAAENGVELSE